MILNKSTRDMLEIGDLLVVDETEELLVTNIIPLQRGKLITVTIYKHPETVWERHNIYALPMSNYYGLKIKKKEVKQDDKS